VKFNPVFELTVYAPRSIDPTETTPLTPVIGASHSDQFVVTTVQGIAGTKPYLDIPSAKTGTIDPLNKRTTVGTLKVRIFDPRVTAGGSNAARWVTAFIGDGQGANYLNGRKVRVRWKGNPGDAYEDYWTGRISSVELDGKQWVGLTFRDQSKDLDAEVFVGAPHTSVSAYANLTQIAPVGLLQSYGTASMFPLTTPLVGKVTTFPSGTDPHFSIVLDLTNGDTSRTLVTQAIGEAVRASTAGSSNKRTPGQPIVYVRAAGTADPWVAYQFGNIGRISTSSIPSVDAQPFAGGAAMPANGSTVEFYIVLDAEPSESRPLLINDKNPIDFISDLAAGYFGKLDSAGAPIRAVAVNASSITAAKTYSYLPWRKRVVKKRKLVEELEEVCRAYHLAYYLNESGELCVVNLRRRATTASVRTLTDADLESPDSNLTWQQSADEAVTSVLGTAVVERLLQNTELPKPNSPLTSGPEEFKAETFWHIGKGGSSFLKYTVDGDFPDIPGGRVVEAVSDVLVPFIGPRAADVRPSTQKIEVAGLRAGVSADGNAYELAPSGGSRLVAIRAHFAEVAAEITGPYGLGPSTIDLVCRRGSANARATRRGEYVALTFTTLPDPATNLRGGPRLGLCLSRTDDGQIIRLKFLDAGAEAVALIPTLGALAVVDSNNRVSVTVPITRNAAGEAVRLRYAITATSVAVQPTEDSPLWTSVPVVTTLDLTVPIGGMPYGKRIWIEGRSEPTAGLGFKLPSAWASPAGPDFIDTPAMGAPSALSVFGPAAAATLARWTNANNWSDIQVMLVQGAAPGAWTDADVVETLPAGSTIYLIGPRLTNGAQYTIGIRHKDFNGGTSNVTTLTFYAGALQQLRPPSSADGYSQPAIVGRSTILTKRVASSSSYGISVVAREFPSNVEVEEALETGIGTGVYGAFASVGAVESKTGTWTTWTGIAPSDRLRRKLRARHTRDKSTASTYTAEVIVSPWLVDPIAPYPTDGSDLALINLHPTDSADGLTRTFGALCGDGVLTVVLYKTEQPEGTPDDPWPPSDADDLNAWLAAGTGTMEYLTIDPVTREISYTLPLPDATKQVFLQFEPRDGNFNHGPIRRFEIYGLPTVAIPQGTVSVYSNGAYRWQADGPSVAAYARYAESTGGYPDDATAAAGPILTGRSIARDGDTPLTFGQTLYATIVFFTVNNVALPSIKLNGSYLTFQATKTVRYGIRSFPRQTGVTFVNGNARVSAGAFPASGGLGLTPLVPPDCVFSAMHIYCNMRVGTTAASLVHGTLSFGSGTTAPGIAADCDGVPNIGWQLPTAVLYGSFTTNDDLDVGISLTAESAANDVEVAWANFTYIMPQPDKSI
jgi:hypothetical protein